MRFKNEGEVRHWSHSPSKMIYLMEDGFQITWLYLSFIQKSQGLGIGGCGMQQQTLNTFIEMASWYTHHVRSLPFQKKMVPGVEARNLILILVQFFDLVIYPEGSLQRTYTKVV